MKYKLLLIISGLLTASLMAAPAVTSKDNPKLRQALKKYPAADLNGDGILTIQEAAKYRKKMKSGQGGGNNGKRKKLGYDTPPTHNNIKYGPYERNILDLWQADVQQAAPVIVYIHGGGFIAGSKEKAGHLTFIKKR